MTDHRTTWDTYATAWRATTVAAKQAALDASTTPTCCYRDPLTSLVGHAALVDSMLAFHERFPGAHFVTTYFLAHHDRSIARWNMVGSDGAVLGDGVSYGEYGADGRLTAMTGFFDVPATP